MGFIPPSTQELMMWDWTRFEPLYQAVEESQISQENLDTWLADWSRVSESVNELYNRLYVATTRNTADKDVETRYNAFLDEIFPRSQEAEFRLKQKLFAAKVTVPSDFEIPLRNIRAEVELFNSKNLPLQAEEFKLSSEYDRIVGAQTVEWEGGEKTLAQMQPFIQEPDRALRERTWRLVTDRQLADRDGLNELWAHFLQVRLQIASNSGYPDYRSYRWRQLYRFDYTPEDCKRFHSAIERVVVPVAERIYDRRRIRLGVDSLRPWDIGVDPYNRPPLRPYRTIDELISGVSRIFHHVDQQLGADFDLMVREDLLDLDNRKHKAPGGYCTNFDLVRLPFIFSNAVSTHDDVQTLLHEGGHSFHVFESGGLPYYPQLNVGAEFAEVASMGMELLASPFLEQSQGGFYSRQDAARAQIENLETNILFWPYMAVVDAFQHWVYENPELSIQPAACDSAWGQLWTRFMSGMDWSGLDEARVTGWQRKHHIFQYPFYYVEYGMAMLGAVQVWANALHDQAGAVAAYRRALALGGTAALPDLYAAAGARLSFDEKTLQNAVALMEHTIAALEPAAQ